jgi:hypothetical protein
MVVVEEGGDNQLGRRAENLWLQAQVIVGEASRRVQGYQSLQAEQQIEVLNAIGGALTYYPRPVSRYHSTPGQGGHFRYDRHPYSGYRRGCAPT